MTKNLFLLIGILLFTNVLFASVPPTIFNFRIESSEPNRVYFDSDKPISGSSIEGFVISNRSISGISISDGSTANHYFTVSKSFTYWDNNTLRYEGGSNIKDSDNNFLIEFTLSYIVNNIPEPDANTYRYVTTSANGGGDGTSESSAWTIKEAFSKASAGMTVWLKAGNYGNKNLTFYNDGTPSKPIKFVGYKNSIGDITSNYFDYGVTWDTSEMPTLTGVSNSSGIAIQPHEIQYVVFRNLQITNYSGGIQTMSTFCSNLVFDRINGKTFGGSSLDGGSIYAKFINFESFNYGQQWPRTYAGNTDMKFTNIVSINASLAGVYVVGDGRNLFDNVKSYNDRITEPERQDYHIAFNGHNNIARNCHAENFNTTRTNISTHGIGVRGAYNWEGTGSTYNLIEKSTSLNNNENFYFRNWKTDYNVLKDSYSGNNDNGVNYLDAYHENTGGVAFYGGVNHNIVERVTIENVVFGLLYLNDRHEDGSPDETIGQNNIVRNTVVNKTKYPIEVKDDDPGDLFKNNSIINSTINDGRFIMRTGNANVQNFQIINSNITNIHGTGQDVANPDAFGIYQNCNFFDNKDNWHETGNGNVNFDPEYISQNNLQLSSNSPIGVTEGGMVHPLGRYDFDEKYRGGAPSIGAYQYGESTTGSAHVNAGEDQSICSGGEVTLTATGNGDFEWNTGDTSASITVSPAETTIYTVTVTNGDNSASDDVTVTVNEAPLADLGEDIDSCPDNEVTLNVVGNGDFLWSTGDSGSSLVVSPAETTSYVVTATIECGTESLSVTDTIVVNVNTDLVVDAGEDITTCAGTEVTLTASGEGEYLWDNGETTKSITVNPSETYTYTVALTQGECTSSDEVTVSVTEQPVVNVGDDKTICFDDEITLTAEGNGDFLWSTGETTPSIDVNPTETTEYTVTSSVNCGTEVLSVSDTIIVNVTPELTLNVSNDIAFCTNQEVTLTADSNGDVLWSTGEITNSISVNPTETTIYTVTATSGDCSLEDEVTVTISDQPTVDLGNDVSICSGSEIDLTAQGNGSFLWSTGSTKKNITVNPAETTEYIVTVSIDCGSEVLSVSDTIVVNVIPGVTLSVSDDIAICDGTEVTLTAEGNADFLWSNGETTASITVNPTETTTYTVTSGTGDCALTEEVLVTVNDSPEVSLGDDLTICSGESVILTAEGNGDFLWNTGETTANISVNPNSTTTYSVTASTNCGGSDIIVSDEIIINVSENIVLSVSEDVLICSGSEVTLTAEGNGNFLWSNGETTANITVSPSETTSYSVTSGTGNCSKTQEVIVTVEDLPSLDLGDDLTICYGETVTLVVDDYSSILWSNGSKYNSISVRPTETKTYSVTVTSSCGNVSVTDEITVNVGPQITVNAGEDKTICEGESITLSATGNGNFTWSTGETGASITVSPDAPTRYWVTSEIDGCSESDDVYVTVEAAPYVSLDEDITICSGEEITLIVEGSGNFLWNTGATTSSIDVRPTVTTTYSIVASSHCNIDATDEITIYVNNAVNADAGPDISMEPGDTATLTASGGSMYLWSTGETTASISVQPNSSTVYTIEVSNDEGSCNGTDEVTVTVEDIPLTINNGEDITICKDDELILQAYGSDNYLWDNGEMGSTITVNPVVTTRYTVSAQKNGLLETVEILVIVEDCSANKNEEFSLYPNPSTGIVNISLPSQKEKVLINVVSINGKLVYSKEIKGDKNGVFTQINLSRFAKGVYLLKMSNMNYSETKKVLVI